MAFACSVFEPFFPFFLQWPECFVLLLSTTSTSQPSKNLFRLQERQREEEHKIRALAKQKEAESLKIFLPEIEAKKNIQNFFEFIQKPMKCLPSPPKQLIKPKVFSISKAPFSDICRRALWIRICYNSCSQFFNRNLRMSFNAQIS